MTTTPPDQFISPEQWSAIKATVGALTEAEIHNEDHDLPGWFFELRDQLTQLMVATSDPVEPFAVSEHFCYLLDMFVAGSTLQSEIAEGSQLVIDWALQTLMSAATMGIMPNKDGQECIWLVVKSFGEPDDE